MKAALTLLSLVAATTPAFDSTGEVLTLEAALETARSHQPDLRRADAELASSRAQSRQALAGLLPQVTGFIQYQRSTANFVAPPGALPPGLAGSTSANSDTFDFFSGGVTLSQLIYDFGRSWNRRRSLEASTRASEASQGATEVSVAFSVRLAFFEARAAKALVGVAKGSLRNQERHLEQVQGFVEVGTRPEIDLAQARTDLAQARVQLIDAVNSYATAKAELARAMGVRLEGDFEVADAEMPPVDGEGLSSRALVELAGAARPDIAALEHQVEAQARSLSSVRGGYGPQLSAATSFDEAGSSLDGLVWNWDVTVTLSWSLYDGGLTQAQAREARAALDRARAELDALKLSIEVEVERARLGIVAARASIGASSDAVTSAREQLRLAEGRYETGVGNVIELGDARLALANADAQSVQAEYQLATARAQLLSALGRP